MIIDNIEQMNEFSKKLAAMLEPGDVINLKGDLGAGKTTIVSFICDYLGMEEASSPSFALVNIYDNKKGLSKIPKIYHLDLYRFEDEDEILDIDFETYFYPEAEVTFVEWGENVASYLPKDRVNIEIKKLEEGKREVLIGHKGKREGEIYENFSN